MNNKFRPRFVLLKLSSGLFIFGIALIVFGFLISPAIIRVVSLVADHSSPTSRSFGKSTPPFSFNEPPALSEKAKIATLSGRVFWQSRVASRAAQIKSPITLQQGEEISTGNDGTLAVEFPKGQIVSVFPNSQVSLIQTLPQNLVLEQLSGRVDYVNPEEIPISVRVSNLLVTLSFGKLNISVSPKPPQTTLVVKSGQATAAYNNLQNVTQIKKLNAGQTAVFNSERKTLFWE